MWDTIHISTPFLSVEKLTVNFFESDKNKKRINEKRSVSVFGRNGTGKTTISESLFRLKEQEDTSENDKVKFFTTAFKEDGMECHVVDANDSLLQRLFVYNEHFVDKYIRLGEDKNLNAVIMIDTQPQLKTLLDATDAQLRLENTKLEELEREKQDLESAGSTKSPSYWRQEIMSSLRNDGWAEVAQELSAIKQRKGVTQELVDEISGIPIDDLKLYKSDISKNLGLLRSEIEKLRRIDNLPMISYWQTDKNDVTALTKMLSQEAENLKLDELGQRIMRYFQKNGRESAISNMFVFENEDTRYCPTCFRDISLTEKDVIVNSTKRILTMLASEELTKRLQKIELLTIDEIPIDSIYQRQLEEQVVKYNDGVFQYNAIIENYRDLIRKKIDKPMAVIEADPRTLKQAFQTYLEDRDTIVEAINAYNKRTGILSKLIRRAEELNKQKFVFPLSGAIIAQDAAKKALAENEKLISNVRSKIVDLTSQIGVIKSQLSGQEFALKLMNRMLSRVFLDKERLVLHPETEGYSVWVRGKKVGLKQISVGERNAISLCYFFSTINAGKQSDQHYKDECTVVLDDPISSFDFENKVGILSLIRSEVEAILFGNPHSKVLIMTHDMEIFKHTEKLFADIAEKEKLIKGRAFKGPSTIQPLIYSILPNGLEARSSEAKNDYAHQLRLVYNYAMDNDDYTEGIGNIMRRVIEAFASFNYQEGTSAVFNDPAVLHLLNESDREFFGSFMYRLVLNSESHAEEVVHGIPDLSSADMFSHSELKKTAKLLILFMTTVNELHMQRNINNFNLESVKSWHELVPN